MAGSSWPINLTHCLEWHHPTCLVGKPMRPPQGGISMANQPSTLLGVTSSTCSWDKTHGATTGHDLHGQSTFHIAWCFVIPLARETNPWGHHSAGLGWKSDRNFRFQPNSILIIPILELFFNFEFRISNFQKFLKKSDRNRNVIYNFRNFWISIRK